MRFLIITHVVHSVYSAQVYAYGPYMREMNLWIKSVNEVVIVAPVTRKEPDAIALPMNRSVRLREVPVFDIRSLWGILDTCWKLPKIIYTLARAMAEADHIHLRCPGNMGLLGCLVQLAFPNKKKTVKYAGNWDANSGQPWSYRLQRWILRQPFLSRNMQVLVYGDWPKDPPHILPFFTASYRTDEWTDTPPRLFQATVPVRLLFVGGLLAGKRPMLSVQTAAQLLQRGIQVELHLYGDGPDRRNLMDYIEEKKLGNQVFLHGNVGAEELKTAYRQSHFLLFASRSEGWPKVVAEAMSWGCLPITTAVSCVPQMLGYGERGELVAASVDAMTKKVLHYLEQPREYQDKCRKAMEWARQFTLERFESEIEGLW